MTKKPSKNLLVTSRGCHHRCAVCNHRGLGNTMGTTYGNGVCDEGEAANECIKTHKQVLEICPDPQTGYFPRMAEGGQMRCEYVITNNSSKSIQHILMGLPTCDPPLEVTNTVPSGDNLYLRGAGDPGDPNTHCLKGYHQSAVLDHKLQS